MEDTQLKHIIWIEDFDNKDQRVDQMPSSPEDWDSEEDISGNNHNEDVRIVFDKYASNVILFRDVIEALKYIDEHYFIFDCVVLDINLEKALNPTKKSQLKRIFKEKGVSVGDDIGESCGYYIFLYLLKSGFPASNIIMFTGNKGENNTTGAWEKKFVNAGLLPPISIGKDNGKALVKEIDKFYQNDYYQTRLMVIKACEFWKDKLRVLQNNGNISFNKVYYNEMDMIDVSSFINMLDRVEMLFPITVPFNKGKIYFQAMQVVCMFHEESAKIEKIKKDSNLVWVYHQAIRSFRNWSAHNKFLIDSLDDTVFSYLFLVALRTYFDDDIENGFKELPEFYYETSYYEKNIEKYEEFEKDVSEKFREKYCKLFHKHFNKVKNSQQIEKNKKIWECKDVHSILLESGKCKEKNMSIKDLFFDIMELHLKIDSRFYDDGNNGGVTVKIEVKWDDNIPIFCEKDNSFRKMAYVLFMD